jgi:pimeloyl-ACP methyl ester carboxylesterase
MDDKREVLAIPGRIGGPYTPWVMYPCDAAEARGATIHRLQWTIEGDPLDIPADQRADWVAGQVRPRLSGLSHPLLVGKSLGTHAAILAAELDLPAIWVTPLIAPGQWYGDRVTEALRRATAPCLLIGGTADLSWDGALARELSPHVFEAEGADHGLYVPGPLANSMAVMGEVVTAVERFLDDVIWPS